MDPDDKKSVTGAKIAAGNITLSSGQLTASAGTHTTANKISVHASDPWGNEVRVRVRLICPICKQDVFLMQRLDAYYARSLPSLDIEFDLRKHFVEYMHTDEQWRKAYFDDPANPTAAKRRAEYYRTQIEKDWNKAVFTPTMATVTKGFANAVI